MEQAFRVWSELSSDALAQESFWRDRAAYAQSTGLEPQDLRLLSEGRSGSTLVAGGPWAPANFCCDPGDDPLPDPDPRPAPSPEGQQR